MLLTTYLHTHEKHCTLFVSACLTYSIQFNNQQYAYFSMMQQMQEFYSKAPQVEDKEWKVGDLCAALRESDNRWFRAVVFDIQDSVAKVRETKYITSSNLDLYYR